MSTIADKLTRINSTKEEIQSIVGTDSEKFESYPNMIAKAIVDTPSEQNWSGVRTTADGSSIKDGVAFVDTIKGNTVVNEGELISFNGTAIKSKGRNLADLRGIVGRTTGITCSTDNRDGSLVVTSNRTEYDYFYQKNNIGLVTGKKYTMKSTFVVSDLQDGQTHDVFIALGSKYVSRTISVNGELDVVCSTDNYSYTSSYFSIYTSYGKNNAKVNAKNIQIVEGVYTVDDFPSFTPFCEPDILPLNISEIKDNDGNTLFPYGLCSVGNVYDEINETKAIKRVGASNTEGTISFYELTEPIEVELSVSRHYYKVENCGTEEVVAETLSAPIVANIGYRSAVSGSEAISMLAEAAGV